MVYIPPDWDTDRPCCVGYAVNIMSHLRKIAFLTNMSVRISCVRLSVRTSDRAALPYHRYMYYSARYGHTHAVYAEATATVPRHTGGIAACMYITLS